MSDKAGEEALLGIDPNNLDVNCQNNPRQVRYWGRLYAKAKRAAQDAGNAVKLVKAEVRSAIRADPASYGIDKVTVDAIDDAMTVDGRYRDALDVQVQADYEEAMLKAEVDGLKDRGERLGDMVKLHGQLYFARSPTTREGVQEFNKAKGEGRMNDAADAAAKALKPKKK